MNFRARLVGNGWRWKWTSHTSSGGSMVLGGKWSGRTSVFWVITVGRRSNARLLSWRYTYWGMFWHPSSAPGYVYVDFHALSNWAACWRLSVEFMYLKAPYKPSKLKVEVELAKLILGFSRVYFHVAYVLLLCHCVEIKWSSFPPKFIKLHWLMNIDY